MLDGEHFAFPTYDVFVLLSVPQKDGDAFWLDFLDISFHQDLFPYIRFIPVTVENDDVSGTEIGQEIFSLLRNVQFNDVIAFVGCTSAFVGDGQSQQDVS